MADIHLSSQTGKAVTAQLYNNASPHGDPIPMAEIATTGEYFCNVPPNTPAAKYLVVFQAAGTKLSSGLLAWDGTQEVQISSLPQAVRTALEADGGKLDAAMKAARAARLQTL